MLKKMGVFNSPAYMSPSELLLPVVKCCPIKKYQVVFGYATPCFATYYGLILSESECHCGLVIPDLLTSIVVH